MLQIINHRYVNGFTTIGRINGQRRMVNKKQINKRIIFYGNNKKIESFNGHIKLSLCANFIIQWIETKTESPLYKNKRSEMNGFVREYTRMHVRSSCNHFCSVITDQWFHDHYHCYYQYFINCWPGRESLSKLRTQILHYMMVSWIILNYITEMTAAHFIYKQDKK